MYIESEQSIEYRVLHAEELNKTQMMILYDKVTVEQIVNLNLLNSI